MLELDRSSYTYYETGKSTPTVPAFKRISDLYGVSMDTMMGESQESLVRAMDASHRMKVLEEGGPRVRRILLPGAWIGTRGNAGARLRGAESLGKPLTHGGAGVALCRENRYNNTHGNRRLRRKRFR